MDNSLSDTITALFALASFAGGLSAIIGAGAASIAAIFAWNGLKKIEKELVDQRDQINKLSEIAIELAESNKINEHRLNLMLKPRFVLRFDRVKCKLVFENLGYHARNVTVRKTEGSEKIEVEKVFHQLVGTNKSFDSKLTIGGIKDVERTNFAFKYEDEIGRRYERTGIFSYYEKGNAEVYLEPDEPISPP